MALAGMDPAVAAERLKHATAVAVGLVESAPREQARKLEALVRAELDEEGTADDREPREGLNQAVSEDGRYWPQSPLQNVGFSGLR